MNEHDIELLLQEFEGPKPSDGLLDQIKEQARVPEEMSKTAATSKARFFRPRVLVSAAAVVISALVFTGVLAFLNINQPQTQEESSAGNVRSGTVSVLRDKTEYALKKGDEFYEEDRFLTGAEKYVLMFSDGSELTVDKDTECILENSKTPAGTIIRLAKGRVFADVRKRNGIPFIIRGTGVATVMGTAFGVEEKSGKTRVDVLEGEVKVIGGAEEVFLSRGESGIASISEAVVTGESPHAGTAWIRDWIVFENKPLSEVLFWVEQNSAYRFIDPKETIGEHTVSITIEDESFEQIIQSLMLSCMLRYRIDHFDIYIEE